MYDMPLRSLLLPQGHIPQNSFTFTEGLQAPLHDHKTVPQYTNIAIVTEAGV